MAREELYYGTFVILTAYVVWTTAQVFLSIIGESPPSLPSWAENSPALQLALTPHPIIAAILLPIALACQNHAAYLNGMALNECEPALKYPHLDPFFGLDWLRSSVAALKANRILEHWQKAFQTVGETFWINTLGKWMLMTNEPENLKAILSTSFDDWPIAGPRRDAVLPILGPEAIFSANGQEWHDSRAIMRPSFVRNQISDLACFDRHVSRLLDKIPENGDTVELQDLFYRMSMDSSTDFMFGYSTNTLTDPTPEAVEFCQMFDYVNARSANRARLGVMAFLDRDPKFTRGLDVIHGFVDQFVEKVQAEKAKESKSKAKRNQERSYVFLNEMLESESSPQYIRSQLISLILAGRDTTAGTLSSLFWVLARRPDVVSKLRKEILELDVETPTWEQMKNMKYLNMVIKEALRLYPPVAGMSRTAIKDTVLPVGGGPEGKSPIFIPKGTAVRWTLFSMQRRKDIYGDDAEEFRPERWNDLRVTWEYVPFSGGPRVCIGQQFALTQMSYLLVRVFQTFKAIEPRDDKPMLQGMTITTKLANDLWVSFTKA